MLSGRSSPFLLFVVYRTESFQATSKSHGLHVRQFLFGLRYLKAELREDKGRYFDHLATALFFTDSRYHQWALLTMDRLMRKPGEMIIAARLQVKGGSFRGLR
jgi:hypothetical protein